jgi:outer membrane protein OmpA-like peptidoglycan-associated protein
MKELLNLVAIFVFATVSAQQKLEVFFDFNKDTPNKMAAANLQKWMIENQNAEVTMLSGYCDSVDVNAYNKDLSVRRINSVLGILKMNNIIVSDTVRLKPMGENFKLSKNQAENRRVDVFYNIGKKADDAIAAEASALSGKFLKGKKNSIIRIDNINFYLNSEKVMAESEPILQELYAIMDENPKLRIEIHGHICCNLNKNDTQLSFRRAKFIFTYLLNEGIGLGRLGYKGFGSAVPIFKIPEKNERERIANRRVEILITDK